MEWAGLDAGAAPQGLPAGAWDSRDGTLVPVPFVTGAEWEESGTQGHRWGWEVPGGPLSYCGYALS